MRRLLIGLALIIATITGVRADAGTDMLQDAFSHLPAFITPPVFGQIGGGIFGSGRQAQIVSVGKSGARFSVICNATCATATATCATGSALASITDASITKPYIVSLGPGVYNECVSIDNQTDIALVGAGIDKTIIRPTVTAAADVNGGVVRVGNSTATEDSSNRIGIFNLTVQNDAFSSPEAAIQLGQEGGNSAAAPWDNVIIGNVKTIGHHDSIQWAGDTPNGAACGPQPPRLWVYNTIAIGGRDNVVKKGCSDVRMWSDEVMTKTNYCESTDTAHLASSTGTLASGSSTTVFVLPATETSPASPPATIDDFYVGRKIDFTGSGAPCNVGNQQGWMTDYVGASRQVTVIPALGFTPSNACTYTINAVNNVTTPPCTDIDWTVIASNFAGFGAWKDTGVHLRGLSTTVTDATTDRFEMNNSRIAVEVNDFGPNAAQACVGQGHVNCVLAYTTGGAELNGTFIFDDVDCRMNITMDMQDTQTCTTGVAGVAISDTAQFNGYMQWDGRVTIDNSGDPDVNVQGIVSQSTAAGALKILNGYIDINNTAGGAANVTTSILQANTSTLAVRDIQSDAVLTTSGTETGWYEYCQTQANAAVTDTDVPLAKTDSEVGLQVQYIGCSCKGTCGGAEAVKFEDEAGNQITGSNVTCQDNATAISWVDARADADSLIPVGAMARYDIATAGAATDDFLICVRVTSSRWTP